MLTAAEACAFLGVKPQTLYAYVSRGLVKAEARAGHTGHLYAREDLEALRARSRARSGHGPTAASAMRWGEPILESAITLVRDGELHYRGHALTGLCRRQASFEAVAELLWSGSLPHAGLSWDVPGAARAPRATFPATGEVSEKAFSRWLFQGLGQVALGDEDEDADEFLDTALRRARGLITGMAGFLFAGASHRRPVPGLAAAVAARLGLGDEAAAVAALNTALIVSADHELNASTFAARVAASTGADLQSCMFAGMAAFAGRRHGLHSLAIHRFLASCRGPRDAAAQVARERDAGRLIPGFGHPLYPDGDPRAKILGAAARELALRRGPAAGKPLALMEAVAEAAANHGMPAPNLDFGLLAVAAALGLPASGAARLFVLGRMAGWTAHVLEQRQQGFLLRPRARYVGRAPLEDVGAGR